MGPTASAYEAAKFMADKNIGALVLVERGTVVGIVSERDCAHKLDLRVQITKNLAKNPGNDELIDLSCRTAAYEVATAKWRAGPDPIRNFKSLYSTSESGRSASSAARGT